MIDITKKSKKQKTAETEVEGFRKDLGPFVVAAETTRMPMLFTDAKEPGHPIIFANDAFLSLTGYSREEVLGKNFSYLMARGADSESMPHIEAAFATSSESTSEVCYQRKDGSLFWSAIFISPVYDDSGDVVQHFASLVDLTEHREKETQSRMLIDELNHRVKNTLATVQSIVWQALRNTTDPEILRESIESRLFALSRSHDLLTRENWEGAGLVELIHAALEPFGVANGRSEHFTIKGENTRVPPRIALALGIALHELATNAVKYGAFSNRAGSIAITWQIDPAPEGDRLFFRWEEKNGPAVQPPSRKGYGSRVLERGLASELDGAVQLDYRAQGVVCTIDFPAPHNARNG